MTEALVLTRDKDGKLWMRVEQVASMLRNFATNVRAAPGGVILAEDMDEALNQIAKQLEQGAAKSAASRLVIP